METALFLLKWAAILVVGLLAVALVLAVIWQCILGLLFVADFPYHAPISAYRAFRHRHGYNPTFYIPTAAEIAKVEEIEVRLMQVRDEYATVRSQHALIPTKKDGSIDLRFGGARELDDAMNSLPGAIQSLVEEANTVRDAAQERARQYAMPRARLVGYIAVAGFVVVLLGLAEIISAPTATHWIAQSINNVVRMLDPAMQAVVAFVLSAGFGRRLMMFLRDQRGRQIFRESARLLAKHDNMPTWVLGYRGALDKRAQFQRDGIIA